jgi:hypothetical protein
MKILDHIYELFIVGIIAMPAIPVFEKYGWKAFGLLFGEIE